MKLVIDANILFALAKSSSVASSIFSRFGLKLLAPDFALIELYKYKDELVEKSDIGSFNKIIESLKSKVVFADKNEYKESINKASSLLSDEKDAAYLALALRLGTPLWSNDPHLKEQSIIVVFTTKELVELLSSKE